MSIGWKGYEISNLLFKERLRLKVWFNVEIDS